MLSIQSNILGSTVARGRRLINYRLGEERAGVEYEIEIDADANGFRLGGG